MAYPTAVNNQTTESEIQASFKVLGDSPAMGMGLAHSTAYGRQQAWTKMEAAGRDILPPELRHRAERLFGMSFADVEVRADDRVVSIGALAFAYGRRIYLQPTCSDFEQPENLMLLGHELTHVAQQRQGRAPATAQLLGLPFTDDPALEAEADEMGRRFAAGDSAPDRWSRRAQRSPKASKAVVQRALIVGGQLVSSPGQLPSSVQPVLALVRGAYEWLDWAINDPREIFQFPDAATLVEGVQSGLHGSPLMLLPRLELVVSPRKLLSLPESDLTALHDWEQGGGKDSQKKVVQGILRRNGLWIRSELASASQFLADHGVGKAPVFQVLGLLDQIALLQLLDEPDTPLGRLPGELTTEAAKFGIEHAGNPAEFVDYLQFYLATVEKLGFEKTAKGTISENQKAKLWHRAQGVLDEIRPHLPGLLRCLTFEKQPDPDALEQALNGWIGLGNILGFRRLSAAAGQVYRHSELRQQTGSEMRAIIDRYISRAQRFLLAHRALPGTLSQDGVTWSYDVVGEDGRAVLILSDNEGLTLHKFVPKPQQEQDS